MATKIQIRRDAAANWTSANPILSDGEMGYETDTGYMKIGDGSTAWASLGYFVTSPDNDTTYTISMITSGSNTLIRLLDSDGAADDVAVAPGTGISVTNAADIMTVSLNALLNDVSDVSAASPSTNDLLQWNGAAWANVAPSSAGGFAAIATSGSWTDLSNTPTTLSGYGITDGASTLNDLTDVAATGTNGAILMYTGAEWTAEYAFPSTMEFSSNALMRQSISYYASDYKFFPAISAGDTIQLRDGAYAGGGAGIYWLEKIGADFIASIEDADVNANRYLERKIIVNNNYIAGSETDIVIIGNKSDPSGAYNKTYILRTGDGTTYTYGPTGEAGTPTDGYDGNFYSGIAALGIPGLTIGFDSDNPTYINPTQITYTPQYEGDTLELVEPADPATSGWDHLAMIERVYSRAEGDDGSFASNGVVMTGIKFNGTTVPINWVGGSAPTGGTGRYDIYDIAFYYDSSTYGRQCFIKHSTTDALDVQILNGDLTGSVFAQDSTLLVDAIRGVIVGPVEGDLTGSVFADDSTPVIDGVSGLVKGKLAPSTGATPYDPNESGEIGEIRYDDSYMYLKTPSGEWKRFTLSSYSTPFYLDSVSTALFGGGYDVVGSTGLNVVDYVTIATPGNATDFGDLSELKSSGAMVSDGSTALYAGGGVTGGGYRNVIEYFTIGTPGNAIDFGDLQQIKTALVGVGDGTLAVFAGGLNTGYLNQIDQVTVATPGNATDWGDLTVARYGASASSNSYYGFYRGGIDQTTSMDYIVFATAGNATSFGTLDARTYAASGISDETYAVFAGGAPHDGSTVEMTSIDYVQFGSSGTASAFGDLTQARTQMAGATDATYGLIAGGEVNNPGNTDLDIIDYITIATPGNATDFGDLTVARRGVSGCAGT